MKNGILILIFSFFSISLLAQSTMPKFNGWIDNETFILEKNNKKGESTQVKVNAKMGRRIPMMFLLQYLFLA